MASFSTLLLFIVLPALLATALGDCDYNACYRKLTITDKNDNVVCIAAKDAVDCAEKTLDNNPDCAALKKDIDPVVTRVKKLIQCYCGGNSVSVSFLTLCFGIVLATYFSRSK